jgi:hypothetical protein
VNQHEPFIFQTDMATKVVALYGNGPWVPRLKQYLCTRKHPVPCLDLNDADDQLAAVFGTEPPPGSRRRWIEHQLEHSHKTQAPALVVLGLRDGDDIEVLRAARVQIVAVSGDQLIDDLDVTTLMYELPLQCLLNQFAIESFVESEVFATPSGYQTISAQMTFLYRDPTGPDVMGLLHSIYADNGVAAALIYLLTPQLALKLVTATMAPALWVRLAGDRDAVSLAELLGSVDTVRATKVRSLEPSVGTIKTLRPRFNAKGELVCPGSAQAEAIAGLVEGDTMSLSELDSCLSAASASSWQLTEVMASSPEEAWRAAHDGALQRRFTPRIVSCPPCALSLRCQCTTATDIAYRCVICGPICVACAEAAVLAHGDALAVSGTAVGAPWTVVCPGSGCSQAVWGDKLRPKLSSSSSAHAVLDSIDHMMEATATSSGSQSSKSSPK